MLLGLITLERMTWTQGIATLGPSLGEDKDKASWQQMIRDKRKRKSQEKRQMNSELKRLGTWSSTLALIYSYWLALKCSLNSK